MYISRHRINYPKLGFATCRKGEDALSRVFATIHAKLTSWVSRGKKGMQPNTPTKLPLGFDAEKIAFCGKRMEVEQIFAPNSVFPIDVCGTFLSTTTNFMEIALKYAFDCFFFFVSYRLGRISGSRF